MIKVSTFLHQNELGYTAIPLFGNKGAEAEFEKNASPTLLPTVAQYIAALRPKPDSQYVLVNALGASEYFGSNINGDAFPEAGLIHCPPGWTGNPVVDTSLAASWPYGFPTFYNAHAFAHHRNKDPGRAYGNVELAVWNDLMKRVELVVRVDYDKCLEFGGIPVWDKLKAGQFPDVSMGSKVPFDTSSITLDWDAYNKAKATYDAKRHVSPGQAILEYHKKHPIRGLSITRDDYDEYCLKYMNRILPDGRKVFVYNDYPKFFDISFVFIGADRTAKVMVYIARAPGLDKTAEVLWHGSPKKLDVLEPRQAHGNNNFQNQKAVYVAEDPEMARAYAVGKTLKGKADFSITGDNHIVIVGDKKPAAGYLHKVDVDDAVHGKGAVNEGQAYVKDEVVPEKVTRVAPKEVADRIIRVGDKKELSDVVEQHKVASAEDELLAFLKGAENKSAEIEKEVFPIPHVAKAIPLLTKSEPDIPENVINALSAIPLSNALSTVSGLGMVLRPREFQRIVLVRSGNAPLADMLESQNMVFPKVEESSPCSMTPDGFMPALARMLLPLFEQRTALAPAVERRVVLIDTDAGSKAEPPSSHSDELLRKIGAAYNGYREQLMEMAPYAQDLIKRATTSKDYDLAKVASADPSAVFTPLSYSYLRDAYKDELSFAYTNRGMVQLSH